MKIAANQRIDTYTQGCAGLRLSHLHPNVLSQMMIHKIYWFLRFY